MSGIPTIRRAVIQTIEKKPGDSGPRYQLFVEGTGLQVPPPHTHTAARSSLSRRPPPAARPVFRPGF